MTNLHTIKILAIAGLIIAPIIIASMLLNQPQAQAKGGGEQSQVIEQQTSPQGNATATITITMTGVSDS
jgi:hypothetical protein